jgi:hypothetical protein
MSTPLTFTAPLENIRSPQEIVVVVLGGKLLEDPPRRSSGYRQYSPDAVALR